MLILIGIGIYIIVETNQTLVGILWLLAVAYLILAIFIQSRFKWIVNLIYTLIFVAAGILTLLTNIFETPKFVAVTTFYAGLFLLTFGEFCKCYFENT